MKRLKYLIMALLCVMMISVGLTGCGQKTSSEMEAEAQESIQSENLADVKTYTESLASLLKSVTYQQYTEAVKAGTVSYFSHAFDNDLTYRWKEFNDAHGAVKDVSVLDADKEDEGFSDRIILTGEDGKQMLLTVTYNKSMTPVSNTIADYSDDSKETLGTKLATAGVNTATGLLVVFVILVGLSLIISLFRFVGKAGEVKPQNKDAAPKAAAPAAAPVRKEASEEVSLADNQELVAVIAAAIAAAEDKPAEGYVVRSIRRLHNNKWH